MLFLLIYSRYGSCVPFSPYLLGSGIPCNNNVYKSGTDYVYIKNSNESFQPLNVIGQIEAELHENSLNHCLNSTIRVICHFYLPPCGNSTHFEPPTSVCSDACLLQSEMCPTHWRAFESELRRINNTLSCSNVENAVGPFPHSCSNVGVDTSKLST